MEKANPQRERNDALHGVHAVVRFKKNLTPPTLSETGFINSCEVNTARPSEFSLLMSRQSLPKKVWVHLVRIGLSVCSSNYEEPACFSPALCWLSLCSFSLNKRLISATNSISRVGSCSLAACWQSFCQSSRVSPFKMITSEKI